MAQGKGRKQPVLLGYVDEYMESPCDSFTTNKLGGRADWPPSLPPAPPALCRLCGTAQVLVSQIYAPLGKHLICLLGPYDDTNHYHCVALQCLCCVLSHSLLTDTVPGIVKAINFDTVVTLNFDSDS